MSVRRSALLAVLWVSLPLAASAGLTSIQVVQDSASGLAGASAIAVSPDGQNAYVASASGNSLAMFVRDLSADQFRYIGKLVDGQDGVSGIQGASAVAVSPNGLSVYVTGKTSNALAVFDRSPSSSGLLTFAGALREGIDVTYGLAAPTGVAVGPTGRVYVSSSGDNGFSAFNPSSPTLSQVGVWRNGDANPFGGTISGMTAASGVVAATGTYGTDVYVSSPSDSSVAVFTTNFLFLFGEAEVVQDGVGGFDGLAQAAGLALSPNGHQLYVAGSGDSAIAVLDRSPSTSLLAFHSLAQEGVSSVTGLAAVFGVCAEPTGESVYAAGGESPSFLHFTPDVVALAVDGFDFGLDFVQSTALPGYVGIGGSHVSLASLPDASKILAAESLSLARFGTTGQLSVFDRDGSTGALTAQQTLPEGSGVIGMRGAQAVVASPDGGDVYVLGSDEAVTSSLQRDDSTGTLTFLGIDRGSGDDAFQITAPYRSGVMSPDGKSLYATAFRQDRLEVFQRDASTGLLTPTDVIHDTDVAAGLIRPNAAAVSPDGANVYVVGGEDTQDSTIAIFRRSLSTGALTFTGADRNGPGGLSDFAGPQAIAVSPDGKNVYIANYNADQALAQFSRDPATGDLGFIGYYGDHQQASFAFGQSIAVSPDGRFVYVGASRLATFQRNTSNGNLILVDTQMSVPISGSYHIALNPGGSQIYAAVQGFSRPNGGLARFTRDAATGLPTFQEALSSTTPGDESLQGAVSVAPIGNDLYVAGYDASAVTVFTPEPGTALGGLAALGALAAAQARRRAHR